MKVQWQILLGIFVINLAFGLVMAIGVAGTENVGPVDPSIDPEEYEEHFNATQTAESWSQNPFSGIPVVGDIFAGFNLMYQNIGYLIDGFPILLSYVKDAYIVEPAG